MPHFNLIVAWLFTLLNALYPLNAGAVENAKTTCPAGPAFCSSIDALSEQEIKAMTGVVWQQGCPVKLADLRVIRASHKTFKGAVAFGSVVVHYQHATAIEQVLRQLFETNFPIESMIPIEAFGGDDERSRLANNTSAFNCRTVEGARVFSQHAYGRAIDINPLQNPFVKTTQATLKRRDQPYVDRVASANKLGVIGPQTVPVKAFGQIGWGWGGRWRGNKDYQHFSANHR
jgi:hypothetical protein